MTRRRAAAALAAISYLSWSPVAGQSRPDTIEPLAIGTRAPAFSLEDQFGHQQSNETLRGRNGTVLLFFRSADW